MKKPKKKKTDIATEEEDSDLDMKESQLDEDLHDFIVPDCDSESNSDSDSDVPLAFKVSKAKAQNAQK